MRVAAVVVVIAACGGRAAPSAATVACEPSAEPPAEYQKRWGGLYVRDGERIVDAPAADQALAKTYPTWRCKGAAVDGVRLTIMTAKTAYAIGEAVRVIHVLDASVPGRGVYIMGPKVANDEFVDGARATPPPELAAYPFVGTYDGVVLPSPAIDVNYDVTSYRFATPGAHVFEWKLGGLRSNVVTVQVR